MLTDEYRRPLLFTPVRNPAIPTEYEIPDLLRLMRNGPSEIERRKDHPISHSSLFQHLNVQAERPGVVSKAIPAVVDQHVDIGVWIKVHRLRVACKLRQNHLESHRRLE